MAWGICTRNLKFIGSYEAAKSFWDKSKPFKTDETSVPLDKKTMFHKRLTKQADGGYACTLYNTAMVTYYPDEVHLCCDDRVSSNAFSWNMCPEATNPASERGRMLWEVVTADGLMFYREGRDALVLQPASPKCWKLINEPAQRTREYLDMVKARPIQALIKPYAKWHRLTTRLGANLRLTSYFDRRHKLVDDLLAGEPVDYWQLATLVGPPEKVREIAYQNKQVFALKVLPNSTPPRR